MPTDSTFKKIVRDIVKEEITPLREHFDDKLTEFKFDILREFEKMADQQSAKIQNLFDQILTSEDKIMAELKTAREEREILSAQHHRVLDHEERLEKLEKIHPGNQHLSA